MDRVCENLWQSVYSGSVRIFSVYKYCVFLCSYCRITVKAGWGGRLRLQVLKVTLKKAHKKPVSNQCLAVPVGIASSNSGIWEEKNLPLCLLWIFALAGFIFYLRADSLKGCRFKGEFVRIRRHLCTGIGCPVSPLPCSKSTTEQLGQQSSTYEQGRN